MKRKGLHTGGAKLLQLFALSAGSNIGLGQA